MSPAEQCTMPRLRAADFDYTLPVELIAQEPLRDRDASRLLHVAEGSALRDHRFTDLPRLLRPGDLLVANDTRVRNARLRGRVDGGAMVEILVLERTESGAHLCLAQPAKRILPGTEIVFSPALTATCESIAADHPGARVVRFVGADGGVERLIDACGEAPVPPYIHTPLRDRDRYQTVYARGTAASAAAPTAGLHFTAAMLDALRARGVEWTTLRLEIGLATFAPMRADDVDAHPMHEEHYEVGAAAADAVAAARRRGGRVVAVGTTVVRALESCALGSGLVSAQQGCTRLFVKPGFEFRVVDGLLTNFHQPRSTLLVLMAAFIGEPGWRDAYHHAVAARYRFLSFGDCMLCWRDVS